MTVTRSHELEASDAMHAPEGPVVLIIMDGIGVGAGDEFDAVYRAHTPVLDALREEGLYRELWAHGVRVGLPSDGDMGNSEVGHNILGAGRIFDQGAKCVDSAIAAGTIWDGEWGELTAGVKARDGALHLVGLLSDGNVHASLTHLFAMLDRAAADGVVRAFVHVLLDGRDVPDHSAERYLGLLEDRLCALNEVYGAQFAIASGGGRMTTTMDRYEADWQVVERGWQAHVLGEGRRFLSAAQAIAAFREEHVGISDQQLPAFVIAADAGLGTPLGPIVDGDAVVLYNFRGDRAMQLSRAFVEGDIFDAFDRVRSPQVEFAGMIQYDGDLNMPPRYLVSPASVDGTISECLAATGVTQFACAETQKFGHVTYFWNGNRSGKFAEDLEAYVEIPSDVSPFEQRPWMKSAETADALVAAIEGGTYRFIRANFAGGDMVGHTGRIDAATIAVEAVDLGLARVRQAVEAQKGTLVVTSDHGNADDMVERTADGKPKRSAAGAAQWRTSHSLNPVPFYVLDFSGRCPSMRSGLNQAGLANVAATLLELMGYVPPTDFEPSLVEWSQGAE
jgi:2,3-bisphosphoglycerate-independent phosphoglycerate mutase